MKEHINLQVGNWEIGEKAGFAVAADERHGLIHFVSRADTTLSYSQSRDGGLSWSPVETLPFSGWTPRLAVDGKGTLHMTYHEGEWVGSIMHCSLTDNKWSVPVVVYEDPLYTKLCPRIVVDGADNVHIICWTWYQPSEGEVGWQKSSRCFYRRKKAGVPEFEEAITWGSKVVADKGGFHGGACIDPKGDAHFVYGSYEKDWSWALEHRIRRKDGAWEDRHDYFSGSFLVSDFSLSCAVDANQVLHAALWKSGSSMGPSCYIAKTNPDPWNLIFNANEDWESGTDLLITPSGDTWLSSGNWGGDNEHAETNLASYFYFPSGANAWTQRIHVSPEGHIQAVKDMAHFSDDMTPRWIFYKNKVRLFYADKAQGEKFKYYQRVFGKAE